MIFLKRIYLYTHVRNTHTYIYNHIYICMIYYIYISYTIYTLYIYSILYHIYYIYVYTVCIYIYYTCAVHILVVYIYLFVDSLERLPSLVPVILELFFRGLVKIFTRNQGKTMDL